MPFSGYLKPALKRGLDAIAERESKSKTLVYEEAAALYIDSKKEAK